MIDEYVCSRTYWRVDELGMVSIPAEERDALEVDGVSGNDGAIHMDWEAYIRDGYSHREDVYSLTQLVVVLTFVDRIHWAKGCCGCEK